MEIHMQSTKTHYLLCRIYSIARNQRSSNYYYYPTVDFQVSSLYAQYQDDADILFRIITSLETCNFLLL